MQHNFSCIPATLTAISKTISHPRLGRYLPAAKGDIQYALRLYMWNARLCQEFYIPTQLTEIAFRNALAQGLEKRFGENWHTAAGLVSGLPLRMQNELKRAKTSEFKNHGTNMTSGHIVSAMSLGFWVHLVSANPRQYIWKGNVRLLFPHLPAHIQDADIHTKIDKLRKFRNRIAHHTAVFDRKPVKQYQNIQDIISWICPETFWLMKQSANPAYVLSLRPRT